MKVLKFIAIVAVFMGLTGCAGNPFSSFYQPYNIPQDRLIKSTSKPELILGSDLKNDRYKLNSKGYTEIGSSAFNGANVNMDHALDQAEKLGADLVYCYCNYTDTESGTVPLITPNNQTVIAGGGVATVYGNKLTPISYSVRRYDYIATYWVKAKMPILGVNIMAITTDVKRKIGSNKGLIVTAVREGSPAYIADIIDGDVIVKINDTVISSGKSLQDALLSNAGEEVKISLWRGDKKIQIPVVLGSIN